MAENKSFREAFAVLQGHAETLRQQTEPNIDDLLEIVVESVEAYKVCKTRIDAVEKALQQALTDVGVEGGARQAEEPQERNPAATGSSAPERSARSAPAQRPPKTGFDDMDDDIPF
ncbi:exodeoxyribonuclease VII small subunit [Caenimonas soli]|uniref:exodeoxyribonuclease VII small subunit n=1 Tax=Caenimonas soli TaxID=2735555 RepID=UPI001F1FBE51|nr:exodeoxyribonuclease VII small subunit [Caenimonas soli]